MKHKKKEGDNSDITMILCDVKLRKRFLSLLKDPQKIEFTYQFDSRKKNQCAQSLIVQNFELEVSIQKTTQQ